MVTGRRPPEEDERDAVVLWARRIGRALGYVALFLMALYLLHTYG